MKTKEEIKNLLEEFFEEKAQLYKLEMAFLYGSWARGFPKEDSDIDIALVFIEKPFSEDELFRYINDISLSLSIEIGLEVNAILIRPDFRRPILYYNAIVLGIPVFIRDYDRYVSLKNEAIFQMEDFSLFGIGWQLKIARKNLEELRKHA